MALSLAIYEILRTNANVLATFSDRIYPVVVPIGGTLPCLVYSFSSRIQDEAKDDPDIYDSLTLRITVIADNYTNAEIYHDYVYTALQDYKGTNRSEKILTTTCTQRRQDDIIDRYWAAASSDGQFAFVITMEFEIKRG